jgi:hypothetical protein
MTSKRCWHSSRTLAIVALGLALLPALRAQFGGILSVTPPLKLKAARESVVSSSLPVQLRSGYHVNSNTPADEYLIPLSLTWNASPLEVKGITFPKPKMETYSFSKKPLSVFTGDFEIVTQFAVPGKAPLGAIVLNGKLRYQACSQAACLPPRTVEVRLPVEITAQ